MLVQRFDGGWEEPDDSGEADFAGGGGHLNFEALEIQTPVTLTLDLQKQTHGDLPYWNVYLTVKKSFLFFRSKGFWWLKLNQYLLVTHDSKWQ